MAARLPLYERYMREEEREDDARIAADWRAPRKLIAVRVSLRNRIADAAVRIFTAIRAIPGGEPSVWRDAAVFLVGSAWGVMCTVGVLLAIAGRHAS